MTAVTAVTPNSLKPCLGARFKSYTGSRHKPSQAVTDSIRTEPMGTPAPYLKSHSAYTGGESSSVEIVSLARLSSRYGWTGT